MEVVLIIIIVVIVIAFLYRNCDVPAASIPTIAAAIYKLFF